MGGESPSPLSYKCEREGPSLTRREHRLFAFVMPAHCSEIDESEEVGGLEAARGLSGLTGIVCTLEGTGRGTETETATGAGETVWGREGSRF